MISTSRLEPAYGAHPSIITRIQIQGELELARSNSSSPCSLYVHYTLPPLLFVDPYELEMRAQDYRVIRLRGRGARELEKPTHALPLAEESGIGVELVLEKVLAPGSTNDVQVGLPIHIRYGEPTAEPYVVQAFDAPSVVLACPFTLPQGLDCKDTTLGNGLIASISPFSVGCGTSSSAQNLLEISVPLGNINDLPTVELGTSVVILACFSWIVWEAWRAYLRLQVGKTKSS